MSSSVYKTMKPVEEGQRYELYDPVVLPKASSFLWNKHMMLHMNCRGYAVAQFMQPEPAKYAHAPNIEAKTFMQPEQPYYAHHPGRFFYIKDEENGSLFSAPYEPVRSKADAFTFSAGKSDIKWVIEQNDLRVTLVLSLTTTDPLEMWQFSIENLSENKREISIYPYFPVGYMSWMNLSGQYESHINAIVCTSITPYQKYQDYDTIKDYKDKTFLLADTTPNSWECKQERFEGEGGLHNPSAIQEGQLQNGDARYEMPACIFQYKAELEARSSKTLRFLFGPAKDEKEIEKYKQNYFDKPEVFEKELKNYSEYVANASGVLQIKTPDEELNNMVNHWLPRQVYYHGVSNRLSTDPQTRNYLQDNMGMSYIDSAVIRNAILLALSQQDESGAMPDGILIKEGAELKYINQVPHTDHCVWLPVCLKAYLDETNDYEILAEKVPFAQTGRLASVNVHMKRAMLWLDKNRDERGLNYINQGDWCDPMNMVGYKGKGVSGWLTIATAYAFKVWSAICENNMDMDQANEFERMAQAINQSVNEHLWDGNWYARGITDDNVPFGIANDTEGRIFLNPQAWSLLSGAADKAKRGKIYKAVEDQLESPYGVEMLAPSYTAMRDDVGRVTQKHPGSAENGSVYNHAAAFYIYGLYQSHKADDAYRLLRKMIPSSDLNDVLQRGQMPVFIPNYYRGAYHQYPETAGRSSQLFNTGTAAWYYRIVIEGLFGLKGCRNGLEIKPQFPKEWDDIQVVRDFRGATFKVHFLKIAEVVKQEVWVDGQLLEGDVITVLEKGLVYNVEVKLPKP